MEFSTDNPKKLIRNLPEALFLESLQGDILAVNEQACELLGYEREELLELTVEDLVPEGALALLPGRVDEATLAGEPLETVNLTKDGTEIPVELKGGIVEIHGESAILVSIRDINRRKEKAKALKRREKKYKTIFESARLFSRPGNGLQPLESRPGARRRRAAKRSGPEYVRKQE